MRPQKIFEQKSRYGNIFSLVRNKTKSGADIVHVKEPYDQIYDLINPADINIIDYQNINEYDISSFTQLALSRLSKKDTIIVSYFWEALHSTYWNVIFDQIKSQGYKKIIWIDGGLTPGHLFHHLSDIEIVHRNSTTFFKLLFNGTTGFSNDVIPFLKRQYYYLSLGRMARRERIYFTNKILNDPSLADKGIVSCGWGDFSLRTVWNKGSVVDQTNLAAIMSQEEINRFPVSLNHKDKDQHSLMENFDSAVFNIVQESSAGFDTRSYENVYSPVQISWCRSQSDRIFFTEKSSKAFLMMQIPLFISAPGYVESLRKFGFDVFDDIVNHNYDKEDNIFKRCDMVFRELERLVNQKTLDHWNSMLQYKLADRLKKNFLLVKSLGNDQDLIAWINKELKGKK